MRAADEQTSGRPIPRTAIAAAAFGLLAAGGVLVRGGDRAEVAGGVLLSIGGFALAAVALGGAAYGPEVEGPLDLGTRLGLGLLGGVLGAVVAIGGGWALTALGIPGRLGVELPGLEASGGLLLRMSRGAVWGLVFGVLFPKIPGRVAIARGVSFSLIPSLYVLLVVFPTQLDAGWFGIELGAWTFVFVLLLNALWGIVAGRVIGWGERGTPVPGSVPHRA